MVWTSDIGLRLKKFLSSARSRIFIVCPFIQKHALEYLLGEVAPYTIIVVTRWNLPDIISGASDIGVYPYLRERKIPLLIHPRLHMKLIVADNNVVMMTANISTRGLGLGSPCNLECAREPERVESTYMEALAQALHDGSVVNDEYFKALSAYVSQHCSLTASLTAGRKNDDAEQGLFRLSNLPHSTTPSDLLKTLKLLSESRTDSIDSVTFEAAVRDCCLYNLVHEDCIESLRVQLRTAFVNHPFIVALQAFLQKPRFFGQIKSWIREVLVDEPKPSSKSLTPVVQRLFAWITELLGEDFYCCQPNHSQCIVPRSLYGMGTSHSMVRINPATSESVRRAAR